MIILRHYLVTMAGGSGNGNSISGGRSDSGDKSAEINIEIIDAKGKLVEGVIDILETGFDDIAATGIRSGSVLADGVGEGIVGGAFFAGGNIEVTPVDDIT